MKLCTRCWIGFGMGTRQQMDKQLLHSRTFGGSGGLDVEDKEWRILMLIIMRNNIREAWSNIASLRHAVARKYLYHHRLMKELIVIEERWFGGQIRKQSNERKDTIGQTIT